jgi:hypothetical protein
MNFAPPIELRRLTEGYKQAAIAILWTPEKLESKKFLNFPLSITRSGELRQIHNSKRDVDPQSLLPLR